MGTELLKNEKYEIKCTKGDAEEVVIEVTIKAEKLNDKETNEMITTVRKILYAFDRCDSVSSRYGSVNGGKKKK